MNAQKKTIKKYNVIISKLFQTIINLEEEQQLALLHHAEKLLVKEKRAKLRKSCSIPINFSAYNRVYSNHITNISPKGLFIGTQKPLMVGDEILMSFQLEGFERVLKVRGEIAHATRTGVGVEFKNISPYVEEMLSVVIDRMK